MIDILFYFILFYFILSFLYFQEDKSKIEERRKLSEQHVHRLMKEKEHSENLIQTLNKVIEEVEAASRLKSQLWDKKENTFQNYMDNQQLYVKVCFSLVVTNSFSSVLFSLYAIISSFHLFYFLYMISSENCRI
jgi:hypothetical protein